MKKGFSLIELIISLAIVSFLVLLISNLFSLNINILNKSYDDENEYKEAYTSMAYIDTTLRMSHKIEKATNKDSNFNGYIMSSGEISKYYFYSEGGFLYINRANIKNGLEGKQNKISSCGPISLYYDENEEIIKIILTSKNGKYNFRSAIFVGDKQWKKLLWVFMSW